MADPTVGRDPSLSLRMTVVPPAELPHFKPVGITKGPGENAHEYTFVSLDDEQVLKNWEYVYYELTSGEEDEHAQTRAEASPAANESPGLTAIHDGGVARVRRGLPS